MKNPPILFIFLLALPLLLLSQNPKSGKTLDMGTYSLSVPVVPENKSDVLFPVRDLPFDTLAFSDSIPDAQYQLFADNIAARAIQLENIIIGNLNRVTYNRGQLEDEVAVLKDQEEKDEERIELLKTKIKSLKNEEKRLGKDRKKAQKMTERAVAVADSDMKNIRKNLPKVRDEVIELAELAGRSKQWAEQELPKLEAGNTDLQTELVYSEKVKVDAEEKSDAEESEQGENSKKSKKKQRNTKKENEDDFSEIEENEEEMAKNTRKKSKERRESRSENENSEEVAAEINNVSEKESTITASMETIGIFGGRPEDYAQYDRKKDVLFNPPPFPCNLVINAVDDFSGKLHKQTEEAELFRFTNDYMKPYLNGKPHILSYASLSQLGEVTAISLWVYVRDNNAERAFGGIRQNNVLTLRFLDGSTKQTPNLKQMDPQQLEGGAVTLYQATFPLDKSMLKKLRTEVLDKVRLQWNTGYEDYEIFNIDLLMRQLECIF